MFSYEGPESEKNIYTDYNLEIPNKKIVKRHKYENERKISRRCVERIRS